MNARFARRLTVVSTLLVAGVLFAIIIGGSLFAFAQYVDAIDREATTVLSATLAEIDVDPARTDARLAAQIAASHYFRSELVIILIDERRRVVIQRERSRAGSPTAPLIAIKTRGDLSNEPHAQGPFARLALGLATIFGMQAQRGHVGTIDVFVRDNDAVVVESVRAFVPGFFGTLALALVAAFAIARLLSRQALRPLNDVTAALERFAAGDLTPQPIAGDSTHQLGDLTDAYNGAIEQMERAFDERERAYAAQQQFIADAGHQLRTPLTAIRGFLAILRKGDLRTPSDRDRILDSMHRQTLVIGSLVDKLIMLERWERREGGDSAEPIEVAQLIDDVVSPISEAQPGREVHLDLEDRSLVAIDPSDLAQAVTNLVDNALKYTTGTVAVSVRGGGSNVVVEVADEGPGMTDEETRHAFDRFYRGGRRHVEGSGLGLAIAKRAVENAHGTIRLESSPGHGTRFTIALPRRGPAQATIPRG